MLDPNFMHSVVLLCSVEPEGAMGFVLNHPTGFSAGDLLGRYEGLESSELEVFSGGPVGRDQMHFLHTQPDAIPGGAQIQAGVFLGGEFERLCARLPGAQADAQDLRLFVGYSGWGAGQLEAEIEQDSWIVVAPQKHHPMEYPTPSREGYWRRLLSAQGPLGKVLASLPPDPSWN